MPFRVAGTLCTARRAMHRPSRLTAPVRLGIDVKVRPKTSVVHIACRIPARVSHPPTRFDPPRIHTVPRSFTCRASSEWRSRMRRLASPSRTTVPRRRPVEPPPRTARARVYPPRPAPTGGTSHDASPAHRKTTTTTRMRTTSATRTTVTPDSPCPRRDYTRVRTEETGPALPDPARTCYTEDK